MPNFALKCVAVFIVCLAACSSSEPKERSQTKPTATSSSRSAARAASQWYQGGSLHRSDVKAWRNGAAANRLATCADFAATRLSDEEKKAMKTMDDLKPIAQNLCQCINVAVNDLPRELDGQNIAEVASACTLIMR